ncbi:hypothetical protein EE612_039725 [Oryza sativa]|nr:hypothetical protein EE612_039725 [Oryza sativa]
MDFGPCNETLDTELLHVLTSGDEVRMADLLGRERRGHGHSLSQVAIRVDDDDDGRAPAGASRLLGVTTGNGNTALHVAATAGTPRSRRWSARRRPRWPPRATGSSTRLCTARPSPGTATWRPASCQRCCEPAARRQRRCRCGGRRTAWAPPPCTRPCGTATPGWWLSSWRRLPSWPPWPTTVASRRCTWRRRLAPWTLSGRCSTRCLMERPRRPRPLVRTDGQLCILRQLLAKKSREKYWTGSQRVEHC